MRRRIFYDDPHRRNEHSGTRTVEEGARVIVHLATLPADGPTGGFFNDQGLSRGSRAPHRGWADNDFLG